MAPMLLTSSSMSETVAARAPGRRVAEDRTRDQPGARRPGRMLSRLAAVLALLALALSGCAGGGGSASAGGGGGDCTDGSWCGSRLDRNGDGQISQQEWDDAFRSADTDGDGQISQGEFAAAGGGWGGGHGR